MEPQTPPSLLILTKQKNALFPYYNRKTSHWQFYARKSGNGFNSLPNELKEDLIYRATPLCRWCGDKNPKEYRCLFQWIGFPEDINSNDSILIHFCDNCISKQTEWDNIYKFYRLRNKTPFLHPASWAYAFVNGFVTMLNFEYHPMHLFGIKSLEQRLLLFLDEWKPLEDKCFVNDIFYCYVYFFRC
jgi:hypothetical protein